MAILVSVAVNVFTFLVLENLNGAGSPENRRTHRARTTFTVLKKTEVLEPELPVPDDPLPEPEIMTVDLDQFVPQSVVLDPVLFEISMPAASEYSVPAAAFLIEPQTGKRCRTGADESQSDHPMSASRVDEPPREITDLSPHYPRAALKRGIEGLVVVKLLIDERGRVTDTRIIRVEGHASFREAVLRVAKKWRFRPARHCGRPVEVWGIKRVQFKLED